MGKTFGNIDYDRFGANSAGTDCSHPVGWKLFDYRANGRRGQHDIIPIGANREDDKFSTRQRRKHFSFALGKA